MNISLILIAGILSALITFYLNNKIQLGGIMASAGISVFAGGFFYLFPELLNSYLTANLPLIIMGASFIGMATSRIIKQTWVIGISGLFFSIIFLFTGSFFDGFGGNLGSTAAISLGSAYGLNHLIRKLRFLKN